MPPRSAYIHIPFCRRRCFYCDFPIAVVGDKPPNGKGDRINGSNSGTISQYVEVLCQEIRQSEEGATGLDTVFFGGGTPSLLAVEQLAQILAALDRQFGIAADAEISMELDPATFDLDQVKGYQAAGVNRVSLGVQAFQPELLQVTGRSHTVDDILAAIDLIHQANFTNISLDLISGLPHQTLEQWEESLQQAIALAPTHLSCYDLIVEAGTPFSRQYKPGMQPLPSDDLAAEMYRTAQRLLTTDGFHHYEISNYAKPGYQCRHNLVYWHNIPFYGFGMGATSYLNGERFARPRKTWEYEEWVKEQQAEGRLRRERGSAELTVEASVERGQRAEGRRQAVEGRLPGALGEESQEAGAAPSLLDTVMLRLRLAEGLDLEKMTRLFGEDAIAQLWHCLKPYINQGLIELCPMPPEHPVPQSGRLRLTDPEGFLLSNVVLTTIFEAMDDD
jgi:oxygen-independent coproporphyrinogen-3 oxidase